MAWLSCLSWVGPAQQQLWCGNECLSNVKCRNQITLKMPAVGFLVYLRFNVNYRHRARRNRCKPLASFLTIPVACSSPRTCLLTLSLINYFSMSNVLQILPHLWQLKMGMVNAYLLETDDGVLLVDAGWPNRTEAIFNAVQESGHIRLISGIWFSRTVI